MAVLSIDLNADLAEECGDDAAMYPQLSSANICCGEHAGGDSAMRIAVNAAVQHNVVIGAHVGYSDRPNFGRVSVEMDYTSLYKLVTSQLQHLREIANESGTHIKYVKPHGALYHRVGADQDQAKAVIDAVADFDPTLEVLVPETEIIKQACLSRNVKFAHEFFADRAYLPTGHLAPRTEPDSVLHDPMVIAQRVLSWLETGYVVGTDGSMVRVAAESICLHGDTAEAVESARQIKQSLMNSGYEIKSWLS